MLFNSDGSSSYEGIKLRSYLTVEQLHLELEMIPSKWVAKDHPFIAIMTASMRIRECELKSMEKSIYKSIEAVLKYADWTYDIFLFRAKCTMGHRDEKKKKKSKMVEKSYVCSLISLK